MLQVRVGNYKGEEIHVPFSSLLPMVHPNDFVLGGWDISGGWRGRGVGYGGHGGWRVGVYDSRGESSINCNSKLVCPLGINCYPPQAPTSRGMRVVGWGWELCEELAVQPSRGWWMGVGSGVTAAPLLPRLAPVY